MYRNGEGEAAVITRRARRRFTFRRKEAGLLPLPPAASNEIKTPYKNRRFVNHAEEDLARNVDRDIKRSTQSKSTAVC